MNRWLCSSWEVFDRRSAWNQVTGKPRVGHMVDCKEMGLGFKYGRITGGRRNGSSQDFHHCSIGDDMQTDDWGSYVGVAGVDFVSEHPWSVDEYGPEWLCWDCRWRTGELSIVETQFCTPPHHRDLDHSTYDASCPYIGCSTNPDGDNTRSGRNVPVCCWRDAT
jgi:hypothetical protein